MKHPPVDDDAAWERWRHEWSLRADTTYLNHGSFGPPPRPVVAARRVWQERLDEQPMDFFVRQLPSAWREARRRLAVFVGASEEDLVLVDNATVAMNVVADTFPLRPGDEVVLTDHEYGSVQRIWERACRRAGTGPPRVVRLPLPVESAEQVGEALDRGMGPATRLLVISHITSPTAIVLPVREVCQAAGRRGIAVCIDGPHAPAQTEIDIRRLGCDFYTASCHKWLSAPFGSGFLYMHPRYQQQVQPPVLSWGRTPPESYAETWADEFLWVGTRDLSAQLAIPAAIDFMQSVGLKAFRAGTHALARYARAQISALTGTTPYVPDSPQWYGAMTCIPLPPGEDWPLQVALWKQFGIEVPINEWNGHRHIRVSCHLYNRRADIDRLVEALRKFV